MPDDVAETARLMKVIDAIIAELQRQGVAAEMAELGFDITALGQAVIEAADGQVIPFPPRK